MGLTKSDLFTKQQNEMANMAKAIGHPARIAILQHLVKKNACVCGDLVEVACQFYACDFIGNYGYGRCQKFQPCSLGRCRTNRHCMDYHNSDYGLTCGCCCSRLFVDLKVVN